MHWSRLKVTESIVAVRDKTNQSFSNALQDDCCEHIAAQTILGIIDSPRPSAHAQTAWSASTAHDGSAPRKS